MGHDYSGVGEQREDGRVDGDDADEYTGRVLSSVDEVLTDDSLRAEG